MAGESFKSKCSAIIPNLERWMGKVSSDFTLSSCTSEIQRGMTIASRGFGNIYFLLEKTISDPPIVLADAIIT